jgi:hypothetical protein
MPAPAADDSTAPSPVSPVWCSGFLGKEGRGPLGKAWKRRWFVISGNGLMAYYSDMRAFMDNKPPIKGRVMNVRNAVQAHPLGVRRWFWLEAGGRRVHLECDDEKEFGEWIENLVTSGATLREGRA